MGRIIFRKTSGALEPSPSTRLSRPCGGNPWFHSHVKRQRRAKHAAPSAPAANRGFPATRAGMTGAEGSGPRRTHRARRRTPILRTRKLKFQSLFRTIGRRGAASKVPVMSMSAAPAPAPAPAPASRSATPRTARSGFWATRPSTCWRPVAVPTKARRRTPRAFMSGTSSSS